MKNNLSDRTLELALEALVNSLLWKIVASIKNNSK
jgi:hypothetical protein